MHLLDGLAETGGAYPLASIGETETCGLWTADSPPPPYRMLNSSAANNNNGSDARGCAAMDVDNATAAHRANSATAVPTGISLRYSYFSIASMDFAQACHQYCA